MAAASLGRACCFQLGIKVENLPWVVPCPTWRNVQRSRPQLVARHSAVAEEASSVGTNVTPEQWGPLIIERLYEDDFIIGVSKPGTLLVHNNKGATLLEKQRNAFLKNMVEAQLTAGCKVSPVHRLDRPASGVMIFSKTGDATRAAQAALAHPACIKEYVVLARGSTPDFFVCDEPVNDDKGIPRSAVSKCEKILDLPEARCSLLKVTIKTGRWHQIRKHLNHRAHHVVGDVQHGKGGTNRFFREHYKMRSGRIFLHAARLTFPHPLHLTRSSWMPGVEHSTDDMEHMDQYNLDIQVENSELEVKSTGSRPAGQTLWMAPSTSFSEDLNSRHQLLTIRARLPDDLLQVLHAIPESLDHGKLLSLGLVFQ